MSDEDTLCLPVVERRINGRKYALQRLGFWSLLDSMNEAKVVIGPSLITLLSDPASSGAIRKLAEGSADVEISGASIGDALLGLLGRMTGPEARPLIERLALLTEVEFWPGRMASLDTERARIWFGRYPGDFLPWCAAEMEVQFRDFFEPVIAAIGGLLAADPASPSPSASPGTGPCSDA